LILKNILFLKTINNYAFTFDGKTNIKDSTVKGFNTDIYDKHIYLSGFLSKFRLYKKIKDTVVKESLYLKINNGEVNE
jgi:hypothetical protein